MHGILNKTTGTKRSGFNFILAAAMFAIIALMGSGCSSSSSGSSVVETPPNTPATRYEQIVGKYNPGAENTYGDETIIFDGSHSRVLRSQWATPDGTIHQGFKLQIKVKNEHGSLLLAATTDAPFLHLDRVNNTEQWGWEQLDRWDDLVGNPVLEYSAIFGDGKDASSIESQRVSNELFEELCQVGAAIQGEMLRQAGATELQIKAAAAATHIQPERDGNGDVTTFLIAYDKRIHQFNHPYPLQLGVGAKPKALGGVGSELNGLGFNDGSTTINNWSETNDGAEAIFGGLTFAGVLTVLTASAPACPFEYILGSVEFIDAGGNNGTPIEEDDFTARITPTSATIKVGQTQQFTGTCLKNGNVMPGHGGSFQVDGNGTVTSAGLFTATAVGTAHVVFDCGNGATATATITITAADIITPPGKTLDNKPFTDAQLFGIIDPEAPTLNESTNDYQQFWPILAFPTMTEALRQELWHVQGWEAKMKNGNAAPAGTITQGGMWSAAISGIGEFIVKANVVVDTYVGTVLTPTTRSIETDVHVIGQGTSRVVSSVRQYDDPITGRHVIELYLK